MSPVRKIAPNDKIHRPSVLNRSTDDMLTGSGFLADGTDFDGFAKRTDVVADRLGRDAGVAKAGEVTVTDVRYREGDPRRHGALLAGADERAALVAADTSAAARVSGIVLPRGTLEVGTNVTVASDIAFMPGAKLKPRAGVIITLNGAITANLAQIFDLSAGGSVIFGATARVSKVHPAWFRAIVDGAAIVAAANAAFAPGADVALPPGTIACNEGQAPPRTVGYDGPGEQFCTLDFSSATGAFPDSACIYQAGDPFAALPALGAPVAVGASQVTFASAPDLAPGDVFVLYDSADFSYSTARTTYRAGEYLRVKSVAGNVLQLDSLTFAAYASGSTVSAYKMANAARGKFKGFRIKPKVSPGVAGLRIERAIGIDVDVHAGSADHASIYVQNIFEGRVRGSALNQTTTTTGTGYGLAIGNSQRLKVLGGDWCGDRHGTTVGGGGSIGCVPNRHIFLFDATISNWRNAEMHGADFHGNVEYSGYIDCTLLNGLNIGGQYNGMHGGRVRQAKGYSAIHATEWLSPNFTFDNIDVEVLGDIVDTNYGLINIGYSAGLDYMTGSGVLRVRNVRINGKAFKGHGLYIYLLTTVGVGEMDIEVDDLRVQRDPTDFAVATYRSLYIRAADGKDPRNVSVNGLRARGSTLFIDAAPKLLVMKDNQSVDANAEGLAVVYSQTTPRYATQSWLVEDSVVTGSRGCGIQLSGIQASTTLRFLNNHATNANQGAGGTSSTGSSFFLTKFLSVERRGNTHGDTQAVPTQIRSHAMSLITTLDEADERLVGTVTTSNVVTITTRRVLNDWWEDRINGAATVTVGLSGPKQRLNVALTGNRLITLVTTNAGNGARFFFTRTAASTGAFTWDIGGLKSLATGQWCIVEFDGTAWFLVAFGSL